MEQHGWEFWVNLVVDIGAIIAVVFAIKQFRDASEHTDILNRISHSLSTRYVGEFLEYVREVVDLIGRAKDSLVICCDLPAYCGFSDVRLGQRYRDAIVRKMNSTEVTVRMVCLGQESRLRFNKGQFREEIAAWNTKPQSFREQLARFIQHVHADEAERTPEQFLALLDQQDLNFLSTLAPINPTEYPGDIPFYFWIIDGREAIFAIPSLVHESEEYGFATADPRLINDFMKMFTRYERETKRDLKRNATSGP